MHLHTCTPTHTCAGAVADKIFAQLDADASGRVTYLEMVNYLKAGRRSMSNDTRRLLTLMATEEPEDEVMICSLVNEGGCPR